MRPAAKLLIAAVAVAAGVGAFVATVATRGGSPAAPAPPVARWLGLSQEQTRAVEAADPTFAAETDALRADLCGQREKLAGLLEDTATPKQQILDQVELVIAAQEKLTRRVAEHLVTIRPLLTPQQQRQLMGMCASEVRCAAPCRLRQGGTSSEPPRGGPRRQDGWPGGGRGGRGWGGGR